MDSKSCLHRNSETQYSMRLICMSHGLVENTSAAHLVAACYTQASMPWREMCIPMAGYPICSGANECRVILRAAEQNTHRQLLNCFTLECRTRPTCQMNQAFCCHCITSVQFGEWSFRKVHVLRTHCTHTLMLAAIAHGWATVSIMALFEFTSQEASLNSSQEASWNCSQD